MPRRDKRFIIIENGWEKYMKEKMQSAGILMEILKNDDDLSAKICGISYVKNCSMDVVFYLIGSDDFVSKTKRIISETGFKRSVNCEFLSEDSFMEAFNYKFPSPASVNQKQKKEKVSILKNEMDKLGNTKITEAELAAVMIAADEIKNYRISPPTKDNIRKFLIKKTEPYLQDKARAEMVVDVYIESRFSRQSLN